MKKPTSVTVRQEKKDLLAGEFDPNAFNESFSNDKEEINRVFRHLFKKYPIGDEMDEAFNRLFVAFAELRVFQRWSVARVVRAEVKRRTGSDRKAENVYRRLLKAGTEEADRVASEMGINLKSKRGQFLYKWTEHIMGQEYLTDGHRMRRFSCIDPDNSCHSSWGTSRRNVGFIPWSARPRDADPEDYYEGSGAWGIPVSHDSRHFPHYEDAPSCVGEHTYANAMCSVDQDAMENELLCGIHADTDDTDRMILAKRSEGYSIREVQEHLNASSSKTISHQGVAIRLTKLRTKPTTRAVAG